LFNQPAHVGEKELAVKNVLAGQRARGAGPALAKLRELGDLYWSSCPDTELVSELARKGVKLVVDLTEGECWYELPPGVEKLEYPIPDFSYKAFEGVLADVVLPALERLRRGEGVLIHCRGGIGRSGVTVGMLLALRDDLVEKGLLQRLRRLGYVGETASQNLALRWFLRARRLVEVKWIAAMVKRMKGLGRPPCSYWELYGDHASTIAGIALDALEAVTDRFGLSAMELRSAYAAGLLHDAGRVLGPASSHHELGAELAKGLEEVKSCCDPELVAKAIFHHRRGTDLLGDEELREMGLGAQLVAAAVRLGDAFNSAYEGEGCYAGAELRSSELVLLLTGYQLGCVDLERLRGKAEAFGKLAGLEVRAELL